MKPKVSIIVPIYRVEKYLNTCVDSLLNQNLQDIEIILVDDGSPDKSGEIADTYAQKEKRVKVIHQSNSGLGPARNTGIKAATGEYIGFVDSDDWVKPGMYETLYETAVKENADIVVSGHREITNGTETYIKQHPLAGKTFRTKSEILNIQKKLYGHSPEETEVEAFPMSVCMSIYRKKLFEEYNLEFKNILSEDIIFNLSAYKYPECISFIGITDYCYRKEGQVSITQTFSAEKLLKYQEFLTTLTYMAELEKDAECSIRAKRSAIDYCRMYVGLVEGSKSSFKEKKNYVIDFAQTKEIYNCWLGYPIETLPIQQKIFHNMIIKKQYGMALLLSRIRLILKKIKLKYCQIKKI